MFIVPCSFLQSDFWEKRRVSTINDDFSFIGQMKLPPNAFSSVGVEDFATKVMVFSRQSEHIENNPYLPEEFLNEDEFTSTMVYHTLKYYNRRTALFSNIGNRE